VRHAAEAGQSTRRLALARQHDHHVAADRGELAAHVAARAFAERGQRHHRGDADRHSEQAEPAPQSMPAQRAHREADEIDQAHASFSAAASISTASWMRLPGPR
jgi:hypothetical protein